MRKAALDVGVRVLRDGDNVPGTVTALPKGPRVVVWWDSGREGRHDVQTLRLKPHTTEETP